MKRYLLLILAVCAAFSIFTSCNKPQSGPDDAEPDGESLTLRVGTYNIKNGAGVGYDMSVLASDITACNLDVVGLQEVDINTKRSGYKNTLKLLADAAGYPYYKFARAIDFQGGEYGTAILSRYPITSFEVITLTTDADMEARSLGHAVIDVNGVSIDFFNTHLSFENTEIRIKQFEEIYEKTKTSKAFIITADFNTAVNSEFAYIRDSFRANDNTYNTFSNKSAIDDIVLSRQWTVTDKGMADIKTHSDHSLFWAEIKYNDPL